MSEDQHDIIEQTPVEESDLPDPNRQCDTEQIEAEQPPQEDTFDASLSDEEDEEEVQQQQHQQAEEADVKEDEPESRKSGTSSPPPGQISGAQRRGSTTRDNLGEVVAGGAGDDDETDVTFTEEAVAKLLKKGLKEPDERPHMNVVFIGHVDAGKSTTCGNILFSTGQVDARTIEKYEREAKEKNRDTWYYAYVMDINEEERTKGKTVEVGRAAFNLDNIRYTILDAPGHKGFVPEMLAGAAQADVGVLIISARKGEFEAGFERGGQTREHAMLAKTLGVDKLVVAINKMDEFTVQWNEQRYEDIMNKLSVFLKTCGFGKDVIFVPMSGLNGHNVMYHVADKDHKCYEPKASWYGRDKPTLLEILANVTPPKRDSSGPLRIPLLAGYKDGGVVAVGKVESGVAMVDQPALLMPSRQKVKILGVRNNEEEYAYAKPGENVELRLLGVDEDAIRKGCVLSSIHQRVTVARVFEVQMVVVELLEHRPILTNGYKAGRSYKSVHSLIICIIVMHAHTACEEVEVDKLIEAVHRSTKKKQKRPAFVRADVIVTCRLKVSVEMQPMRLPF